MEYQVKESKLSQLSARLNLMVVLVLGLMVSNLILAYQAMYASRHQKREVVPFACTSGYVISDSSIDVHYLNLMTRNFVYTRLNVTPQNVNKNHGELLDYVDSSTYSQFKKKLAKEEAIIKSKKIASTFDITDVQSDNQKLISIVKGHLKRFVGYRALKDEERTYRIQYRYQQGQLTITGFTQEKGENNG
jgi:conjugal transfer pilus assembly protein TraE